MSTGKNQSKTYLWVCLELAASTDLLVDHSTDVLAELCILVEWAGQQLFESRDCRRVARSALCCVARSSVLGSS